LIPGVGSPVYGGTRGPIDNDLREIQPTLQRNQNYNNRGKKLILIDRKDHNVGEINYGDGKRFG